MKTDRKDKGEGLVGLRVVKGLICGVLEGSRVLGSGSLAVLNYKNLKEEGVQRGFRRGFNWVIFSHFDLPIYHHRVCYPLQFFIIVYFCPFWVIVV